MDLEPELQGIESKLRAGELRWDIALSLFIDFRRRHIPWKSAAWARERAEKIGSNCQQCGLTEEPMVLQHLWHPPSFDSIFKDLAGPRWKEYKQKHRDAVTESLKVEQLGCPRCTSANLRWQKRKKNWRCQTCGNLFPEKVKVRALTKRGRSDVSLIRRLGSEKLWRTFQQEHGSEFGTAAVLAAIEASRRYLSLVDVVTFCKKCTFLWDVKAMRLCQVCRSRYHSLLWETCDSCKHARV